MGKVGQLVMEAQEFAQDHYNMDLRVSGTLLLISGSTQCSCVSCCALGRFRLTLHCLMMRWSSMLKILSLHFADNDLAPEDYNQILKRRRWNEV